MRIVKIILGAAALISANPAYALNDSYLAELEARIAATASENPGEYGIAALDLETGKEIGINLDMRFPMASTMKIAVAAMYLDEVDEGKRSLDDIVGGQTAYALMDRMMVRSDNYATDLLISRLGGPARINQWLINHGVQDMRVDRTIAQLLAARRNLWEHEDSSTPRAMITFLARLDKGEIVSIESRDIILDMMRRCATGSNRIKGLMEPGTIVEHKTGTLRNYTSDVGFLTLPNGRRIVVAFFARGGVNRPAVIATTARVIRDGFEQASSENQVARWNTDYPRQTSNQTGIHPTESFASAPAGNPNP